MPPAALTLQLSLTVSFINLTSSIVAPFVLKPVDVLTKAAFASSAHLQAAIFSSSVNRQVSMITLTIAGLLASTISLISFVTYL